MARLSFTGRVFRLLRTVRHLKPVQVAWRLRNAGVAVVRRLFPGRLRNRLKRRASRHTPVEWSSPTVAALSQLRLERAGFRRSQADSVLRGEFRLCNRTFGFDEGVGWHRDDLRRDVPLAGFELQYQGYLEDLALARKRSGDDGYLHAWEGLVESWIEGNPPSGTGSERYSWSPYVVSERVRNWLSSLHALHGLLPPDLLRRIERSLAAQVEYLRANPELDLQGNHLLQNLCGAAVGLGCLEGGAATAEAFGRLSQVAAEQTLADGMHEERSYAYHVKAMCDLDDALAVGRSLWERGASPKLHAALHSLTETRKRMASFLEATLKDLPEAPLLNDSEDLDSGFLRWLTGRSTSASKRVSNRDRLTGSGYLQRSLGPWSAVFDVGKGAPDHQMGHAHADHLTLELWVEGHKLLADSGTPTYTPGTDRQLCRGTPAHSTVAIDHRDSLELWSAFRVGRRPRHHVGRVLREEESGSLWYGEHDGYRHLPGSPRHRRWVHLEAGGLVVRDTIQGSGRHHISSAMHFHCAVGLSACDPQLPLSVRDILQAGELGEGLPRAALRWSVWEWRMPDGGPSGRLFCASVGDPRLDVAMGVGSFAPRFFEVHKRAVLRAEGECVLPESVIWVLTSAE